MCRPFLSEQFLHYSRLFFDSGRLFVDGYVYDDFMVVPRGKGRCTKSTRYHMFLIRSERVFSVKCSYRRSKSSGNTAFSLIIKLIFPGYLFDSFRSPWAGSRKVEETSNEGRVWR